ncbi:MAG: hypothetical protein IPH18_10290 [Chitinophagaceae bacterium]|nr:hypothetical protein [Chitinophagaceae bacterium]
MRKNYFLVFGITGLLVSNISVAQFQTGEKIAGAGLNFTSSSQNTYSGLTPVDYRSSGINLAFDFGFAKKESRLNGFFVDAGYNVSKTIYPTQGSSNYESDGYTAGAGWFSRRYKPAGKSFFLFAEGRIGVNYSDRQYTNNYYSKEKSYGLNAGIFPGVAYRTGKRLLLELKFADFVSIGYSQTEAVLSYNDKKEKRKNFIFGSSLGLGYLNNFGIGAKWIIPAKGKSIKTGH